MARPVSPVKVQFWQCPHCLSVWDSKKEAVQCELRHTPALRHLNRGGKVKKAPSPRSSHDHSQCTSCGQKHDLVKMPCGAMVRKG